MYKYKYRITAVLKVERDIITRIAASLTFKTEVIVFTGNDIICLTSLQQIISSIRDSWLILTISLCEMKGQMLLMLTISLGEMKGQMLLILTISLGEIK